MSEAWPELKNPGPHSQLWHPAEKIAETNPLDGSIHHTFETVRNVAESNAELYSGNLPSAFHHAEQAVEQGGQAISHGIQEFHTSTKNMEQEHALKAKELPKDQSSVNENQRAINERQEAATHERKELFVERAQIDKEQEQLRMKPQSEWSQHDWDRQTQLWTERIDNDQKLWANDIEQERIDQRQVEVDRAQRNIDDWHSTSHQHYDSSKSEQMEQLRKEHDELKESSSYTESHNTSSHEQPENARGRLRADEQKQADYLKELNQHTEEQSLKGTNSGSGPSERADSGESQSQDQSSQTSTHEASQTQSPNSAPSQSQSQEQSY